MENEIIKGYRQGNHFGRTLGIDFKILQPGNIRYELEVQEKHLATPSAAHGGALAALADATLGVGALSISSEKGNVVSTIEFKISYLAPANIGDVIRAESKLVKQGKSLIFMQAKIHNQNDELIAEANGTFNQYPFEKLLKTLD